MTEDKKDASSKWGDPTSSYEDAMAIKKMVEKVKDQKAQDQKEEDKQSS